MGYIILGIVIVLIFAVIAIYNGLVMAIQKVKNAWSQIDVKLKRRFELMQILVVVVRG